MLHEVLGALRKMRPFWALALVLSSHSLLVQSAPFVDGETGFRNLDSVLNFWERTANAAALVRSCHTLHLF